MTPRKLTSIRFSADTRHQIDEIAREADASQAEVIAVAVDALYQKRQAQKLVNQLIDLLNENGVKADESDHLSIDIAPDKTLTIHRSGAGTFAYTITDDGKMIEQQAGQIDEVTTFKKGKK